jgi:hypothetical protein
MSDREKSAAVLLDELASLDPQERREIPMTLRSVSATFSEVREGRTASYVVGTLANLLDPNQPSRLWHNDGEGGRPAQRRGAASSTATAVAFTTAVSHALAHSPGRPNGRRPSRSAGHVGSPAWNMRGSCTPSGNGGRPRTGR